MDFVHLHVHDHYSTLDSICKTEVLIEKAKNLGFKTLAQTNHGNVDGVVKFYRACKKAGIKPIVGSEIYVVDKDTDFSKQRRHHLIVLCKNFLGLQSLMKALTVANQKQFYRRPLITWDQALALENVVVTSACTSGMLSHSSYLSLVQKFKEKFKSDFYLELTPSRWKDQYELFEKAKECNKRFKIPILATNDIHYLCEQDTKAHEVALAIGQRKRWSDADRWKFNVTGLYLKTDKEMYRSLIEFGCTSKQSSVLMDNACEAADLCDFSFPTAKVELPVPSRFGKQNPVEVLRRLSFEGLECLGFSKDKNYRSRLEHEFKEIVDLGFAVYFLILYDLISWCKSVDITVGPGRGSVGGSLLAYCLSITNIDPIKYKLSFERFISPGRIDLPDVDVDFQDDRRSDVINYLKKEYGDLSVIQLRTFGEMHGRQALRDVARVFGINNEETNRASKSIIKRSGGDAREDFSIEDAFLLFEECKEYKKKYPEVVYTASKLEGLIRNVGIHAAGVVINKNDLYNGERCVVLNGKNGEKLANWDKNDIDEFGLMKLDILGLSTLTVLRRAKKKIGELHNKEIVYENIPLNDDKVLGEFSRGNTIGVFQFGSPGLSRYCVEVGIDNFDTLVDVNALWRPGTLKSGMVTEYSEIKNGHKPVSKVSKFYDELTKDTFGILLYQEQIMQVLYKAAGMGWRTVDTVRKAISKSQGTEKIAIFKSEFLQGCKKLKSMSAAEAEKVFDKMVFFGSYGYNRSHSVEYTMLSYWTMYLKVYYPVVFYWALMNYSQEWKRDQYVDDARKNGVKILLPDINYSESIWSIEKDFLRAGLNSVKNVSERSASEIIKARGQESFLSLEDFLSRVNRRVVNKRVVKFLGTAGALKSLGVGVRSCKADIDEVIKGTFLEDGDNDEVLDIIGDSVDFSPSDDPFYKFSAMNKLISSRLDISNIKKLVADKGEGWLLGKIEKVKYGYRDTLIKESKGYADDLGGAYGNFFDPTGRMMVTFSSHLMRAENKDFKRRIETAENVFTLAHCKVNTSRGGRDIKLHIDDLVFLEDLIDDVDLNNFPKIKLGIKHSVDFDLALKDCTACQLHQSCTAPVFPSVGRYNVMILGEAPGFWEDKRGQGFVGKAGQILWSSFAKHKIKREYVYVNNSTKCRPPNNKLPNIGYARKCSKLWLDSEMDRISPVVVFALGSTAADYFIQDAKITELSGKIFWNHKHGCWTVFGIHPAAVIYNRVENKPIFEKSVDVFAGLLRKLF